MVVEGFIIGALIGAAGGLIAGLARRARQKEQLYQETVEIYRERTPWTIRAGDIISYATTEYLVEKVLTFEEEGPRFREAILLGERNARLYISPQNHVVFLFPTTPPDNASSLPDRIQDSTRSYRLLRRGNALVLGECWQYADYEAPPGRLIMLRLSPSGEVEAFTGESLAAPGLLEILPGNG